MKNLMYSFIPHHCIANVARGVLPDSFSNICIIHCTHRYYLNVTLCADEIHIIYAKVKKVTNSDE